MLNAIPADQIRTGGRFSFNGPAVTQKWPPMRYLSTPRRELAAPRYAQSGRAGDQFFQNSLNGRALNSL